MVTTRKQEEKKEAAEAPDNLSKRPAPEDSSLKPTSPPRGQELADIQESEDSEPPTKKVKIETPEEESARLAEGGSPQELEDLEPPTKKVKIETSEEESTRSRKDDEKHSQKNERVRAEGTTERGYIYFFFRPRVETNEPSSIDDVKNLHMLLVPQPPRFSMGKDAVDGPDVEAKEEQMELLEPGADAIPATAALNEPEKHYRLITMGKKVLPDPDSHYGGRKQSFWATVTSVGDDLETLEKGMGEKTYETKTRGTRHDPPTRLVARGCYALVNIPAQKLSDEKTYLGYSLSHPAPSDFGPVQTALGIQRAAAFVLQVKNPQAPTSEGGASTTKDVVYPPVIMDNVFGKGTRGRDPAGLRFAPCSRPEMLDYVGTELLLVAVRGGESGLEDSLGEGRGEALTKVGDEDSEELSVHEIFQELWGESDGGDDIPEALDGEWI